MATAPTPLPKKLGIKEDSVVALVSAPAGFDRALGRLPQGVEVRTSVRGRADTIIFFATRRAELVRRMPSFRRALAPGGGLWVAWPKRTCGIATDLTFEPVQEIGNEAGLADGRVCAINGEWSSVRFVHPAETTRA